MSTRGHPSGSQRRPTKRSCWQACSLDDRIQPPNLWISETVDEVIVHHAHRLHVCIDNGRTNEAESSAFDRDERVTAIPLEKDKPIHIDRNDHRFGRGMAIRLETENPVLHRKNDAKELLEIGDVCGADAAADLDMVVVPLQQSLLIEAQCLGTVGRDIRGEPDLQTMHVSPASCQGSSSSDSTPGVARKNGVFICLHIAHPAKYASRK